MMMIMMMMLSGRDWDEWNGDTTVGTTKGCSCLPPFIETDVAIVVHIDLVKEAGKPPLGHTESSLLKSCAQFLPSNPTIMVSIDRVEEHPQLVLSSLDEDTELCTAAK